MSTSKISLYSVSDLKATLDDHIPLFLTSPNTPSSTPLARSQLFTQSHNSTYIRLGLGYAAVAVAGYIFYLDYYLKQQWHETKFVTLLAVMAYGVLNGLYTLWIWYIEKGLVFEGSKTASSKAVALKIWSASPKQKYDPLYSLTAEWSVGGAQKVKVERVTEFMKFFTSDGYFVPEKFEEWLRGVVVVVGEGSKKKAPLAANLPEEANDEDTIVVRAATPANDSLKSDGGRVDTPTKRKSKKKA